MLLSGHSEASFTLEATPHTGIETLLQPRIETGPLHSRNYAAGRCEGPARPWTSSEIAAAANWWSNLALGQEPLGAHKWFGGGICFGSVTPWDGLDFAIDI